TLQHLDALCARLLAGSRVEEDFGRQSVELDVESVLCSAIGMCLSERLLDVGLRGGATAIAVYVIGDGEGALDKVTLGIVDVVDVLEDHIVVVFTQHCSARFVDGLEVGSVLAQAGKVTNSQTKPGLCLFVVRVDLW